MNTLNVSHIQHFSIGDGPGIRTTVFLKGCPLHCPWCHNPETISPQPQTLFFESVNKRVLYGKQMHIDEVLAQVMEDAPFYQASGGGVTLSGGEPLLQNEGVAALFSLLKEQGVSTLIDTAGDVPWSDFAQVLPVTDWFYYDFKTGSEEKYARVIGANGARVYENLCKLIQMGVMLHVRIPLIVGFNTSVTDSEQIIQKLKNAGVSHVDLLPFHRMGSAKYAAMGRDYAYKDTLPQSKQEIQAIAALYQTHFQVSIE